jgi:3-hydroxyacyl-[acyl-carrier-protein] dehydratase
MRHMSEQESTGPATAVGLSPADEGTLREALKRCSPATLEAALHYRRTGDVAALPTVVLGIIERFVDPEHRPRLKSGETDLRVMEDLGVDSLTMLEVVMLVEESLKVPIKNEELRDLRTIADINVFIEAKVSGKPGAAPAKHFPPEAVLEAMPMQPPFLFVQEATIGAAVANGRYQVAGTEFFLQGHFRNNPVLPASIMLEALGQLAVLFLLRSGAPELERPVDPTAVFFTSCEGVRCQRVVKPGETLALSVRPKRIKAPLATFEGTVKVAGEKAAYAEEITLTFGYQAETVVPSAGAAASTGA